MSKFVYSLRLGVDPNNWDTKKTEDLKAFINQAKIDDINIIINSEELNVGHITKTELRPWLTLTETFKNNLEPLGTTVSMNPWTNILHSDRGRVLSDDFKFGTMVDYKGVEATAVACPFDKEFIKYMSEIYAEYATEAPEYLWMDDDFRHFNHKPLTLGCFCDNHIDYYNQQLKTTHTRQSFSAAVFQKGEPTKERKLFLEQSRQEMNEVALSIAKAVYKKSPTTKLGLMTSQPEWHALEGRDWLGLFDNLSIDQLPTSRPHLPSYNEVPGLKYIREFNRNVRPVAKMMSPDAVMMPELENYMYSLYAKSNKFTQLQLETVLLIGAKGILFNFYDMMGNGVVEAYNHQQILEESKDLLNYSVEKPINLENISGVKVLYSQETVFTRQTKNGTLEEMLPHEYEWLALLSTFGISTTLVSTERSRQLEGQVVAISDQVLRNLSKDEIEQLFEKNNCLLDGTSVEILFELGLESLIKAKEYEWLVPHTGKQTYEEWNGPELLVGVEKARMTVMQQIGNWANVTFEGNSAEVLTTLYNEKNEAVGNGMSVIDERHFILPISYHQRFGWDGQYVNYKEEIIKRHLAKFEVEYLINMPVCQLIREDNRLFITNFTLDDYETITVHLPKEMDRDTIHTTVIDRHGQSESELLRKETFFMLERPLRSFETVIIELNI